MDQCKRCILKGQFNKCQLTDCTYHELWMVGQLHSKIRALEIQVQAQSTVQVDACEYCAGITSEEEGWNFCKL